MDGNYSLADIAAATGGNRSNDGGMFGDNGWWIIILFLLAWGRGGLGGFGGFEGGGGGMPYATQADVRAAVDQQTLISKLDQQTYGLADSTYALNNTIQQGFYGVDRGLCNLGAHLASAIDGVNYNMAKGFCDIGNVINNNTRDILESQNSNTRAILDFLTQDKIATLQAENQNLKLAASQANQNAVLMAAMDANTAQIIRRTGNDCPIPAYVVPNPNCCYGNPVGVGYNGGCGANYAQSFA